MKIGNAKNVKSMLFEHDFHIKKKFGQNFLIDDNILNNIVDAASIDEETGSIEIGPGMGGLTQILCQRSKKVLAYEVDSDLLPILDKTLKDYDNYKIILQDVLVANVKEDIKTYLSGCKKIVVVANLPYYITTPILMHLLENVKEIDTYVVMMQKEVADRICSKPSVKDYNSLSIAVQYRTKAKKVMTVPKTVFIPAPNVDSAVVRLDRYERDKKPLKEMFFFDCVRSSFVQRRKTLVNNLQARFNRTKEELSSYLEELGFNQMTRAENLSLDDFIDLSDYLFPKLEADEIWDLYDKEGNKLGKTISRREQIPEGEYHLIVDIIIENSLKEYLIQRRSLDKIGYPGFWAITGGSVIANETSKMGAKRELFEEMGISVEENELIFLKRFIGNNNLHDFYLVKKDIEDEDICIDQKEVIDYRFASFEQIDKDMKKGIFLASDYLRLKECLGHK